VVEQNLYNQINLLSIQDTLEQSNGRDFNI
jgi:hypothetical protein